MSVKVHEAFSIDSFQDRLLWWDDFLGDQLQDEWRNAGDVGGSAAVVDAQTGGIVRLTTNNVNGDIWYIDWGNIRSLHVDQRLTAEYRFKLNQTTNMTAYLYIQFDFNNAIFFTYSSAAAVNWRIRCRNGGADTTADSGIAADTDYHIFRIECHTHGSSHVHFYIDGVETANSPITTNIPDDAADFLMLRIEMVTGENVAKSGDLDYVVVRQEI